MPVMSAVEGMFCRSAPWRSFALRFVLPWALADQHLEGSVLEIGGGSGVMAAGLARTFSDVQLTVTDVDEQMAASARQRLGGFPNVQVRTADVTALPFGDDAFDSVVSFLMLHHVIEWREALEEVTRVVRPGGTFVGYDLTDTATARLVHRLDGSPHRIIRPSELRDGLTAAGFGESSIRLSLQGHLMRFKAIKPEVAGITRS